MSGLGAQEKREEIERQKAGSGGSKGFLAGASGATQTRQEQCERSLGNLSDLEAELREKQEAGCGGVRSAQRGTGTGRSMSGTFKLGSFSFGWQASCRRGLVNASESLDHT